MIRVKLVQSFVQKRVLVFQSMCLVDQKRSPTDATQESFVFQYNFIGSQYCVDFQSFCPCVPPFMIANLFQKRLMNELKNLNNQSLQYFWN